MLAAELIPPINRKNLCDGAAMHPSGMSYQKAFRLSGNLLFPWRTKEAALPPFVAEGMTEGRNLSFPEDKNPLPQAVYGVQDTAVADVGSESRAQPCTRKRTGAGGVWEPSARHVLNSLQAASY
jgi:hypothetical protein